MLSIEPISVADLEPAELANRIAQVRNELALIFDQKNVSDEVLQLLADFHALVEAAMQKGVLQFKGV